MSDFVQWSEKLATVHYLELFFNNFLRIQHYGATKSKTDQELMHILKNVPADVSFIPYASRNSQRYLSETPNSLITLPDLTVCERAAAEFIQVTEQCANVQYYMMACQFQNGLVVDDRNFAILRERAYRAGVSVVPYETQRSPNYAKNVALLLSPIGTYC